MIHKRLSRLRRYCLNFQDIENYEEAVKSPEGYDLHHRKGIETLDDGTVVIRSKKELKDLNLYYHRPAEELIFLRRLEHNNLHISTNNPMYGKKMSAESRAKISAAARLRTGDKNHMFGRTEDKSPRWKGDLASDHAKYCRLRRQKKRDLLSNQ